jgi:hypothetical protein
MPATTVLLTIHMEYEADRMGVGNKYYAVRTVNSEVGMEQGMLIMSPKLRIMAAYI